jgi:ABC-type glutathione transport system ATPase component
MQTAPLLAYDNHGNPSPLGIIGIVGPCGAGKTTLIQELRNLGIEARHIAQEHSYVPTMWQKITSPHILIFLDVSYSETIRRKKFNWTISEYQDQQSRLAHARSHADLIIQTDSFTIPELVKTILYFLAPKKF